MPPFIDAEMDRLYQHMFASSAFHSIYGNINGDTHAYVATDEGKAVAALLFRITDGKANVLNEQLCLPLEEIDRFCRYLFDRYATVRTISFPVVNNRIESLSFPYRQSRCTHDIVLPMPDTPDDYYNSLGKSTRSYVKRYLNKLKRDYSSMTFKIYEHDEACDEVIRSIITLNKVRIAERQQSSYIDDVEEERIVKLVRRCGLIGVINIDGRICAGTINLRFGENYFLKVVAHDPQYDKYGLGTLCCYLTICECIKRQAREFHFLWGRYEYKYRLLGTQRDLSRLTIYRSHFQFIRHASDAVKLGYQDKVYLAKDWLEHRARKIDDASVYAKATFHCLNGLKTLKRSLMQKKLRYLDLVRGVASSHKK